MTHVLKTTLLALALAITLGALSAHAATDGQRARFHRVGSGHIQTVIVRGGCIDAEDSAANLKLKEYGDGVAVYGCNGKEF